MKLDFHEILDSPRLSKGVAALKIDKEAWPELISSDGKFWTFRHHHSPGHLSGRGIIIKARLATPEGNEWVHPERLECHPDTMEEMRVYYRFYRDNDRYEKSRPYLYMRATTVQDDSASEKYRGTRVIIIQQNKVVLALERPKSDILYQSGVNKPGGTKRINWALFHPDKLREQAIDI